MIRQGIIQFTIKVQVNPSEQKVFWVYEADSSLDAARKLVQNLWLPDDPTMFWVLYIDEKRLELERNSVNTVLNYSPPEHHTTGNICTFSNFENNIYFVKTTNIEKVVGKVSNYAQTPSKSSNKPASRHSVSK